MSLNNKDLNFQLGCRSTVNILPQKLYMEDQRLNKLVKTFFARSTDLRPFLLKRKESPSLIQRMIADIALSFLWWGGGEACKPIMGSRAIQQMKLVTVNFENILLLSSASNEKKGASPTHVTDKLELTDIYEQYADLFLGEGKLDGLLHLEVDNTVKPVQLPRRKNSC
ncbi:hypothetical protein SNE40_018157 [Patella caerulea]|uniref:Uncharacterized protein n=1 Tax=Patella caerulea TaxID=87958 RepID=A0AAN8PAD9_PATCE